MSRYVKLTASGAMLLATTACASFEGMPRPVTQPMAAEYLAGDKAIQDQIQANIEAGEMDAARAVRNDAVWAHIRAADGQFTNFVTSLSKHMRGSNFGLDLGGVLLSSLGAVATGSANELSAAAAALTGARGSVNRELYFEKTMPAILSAMKTNRLQVKTEIARHLINDDVLRYPLQQALADLKDYELAASIDLAIEQITTAAGEARDDQIRQYANATESCGPTEDVAPFWGRLNNFAYRLAESAVGGVPAAGSDNAKNLQALADTFQVVTGTATEPAKNTDEANVQVETIIDARSQYCTANAASTLLAAIHTKTGQQP